MPRKLSDRENLLAEGVNLPQRGRIADVITGRQWIVGWRAQSAFSVFDGANLVFQFNTSGCLRRVYINDRKLVAHQGRLAVLTRRFDVARRMTHDSQTLSIEEQDRVILQLRESASELKQLLADGQARIETIGITPKLLIDQVTVWIRNVNCVDIAHGPGIVG